MSRRILASIAAALAIGTGATGAVAQSDELVGARVGLPEPSHDDGLEAVSFRVGAQPVFGYLTIPEGAVRPPVVLILPDFAGVYLWGNVHGETVEIYTGSLDYATRLLAEHGIASLRIDYRSFDNTDGAWDGGTFLSQVEDARAALDWLRARPELRGSVIGLLGYGHGSLVAASVAAVDHRVASVALWAPIAHPVAFYDRLFGPDFVADALALDVSDFLLVAAPYPTGWEVRFPLSFLRQLHTVSPLAEIARYNGPMLVIDAQRELPALAGEAFLQYHDGREDRVAFDTDRDFDTVDGPETIEAVTMWTLAWFALTM